MSRPSSVVHLNVVDFSAAIAAAKDRALADRAYVIAGASSGRAIVLGLSRRARDEGLVAGMSLAAAQQRAPQILIGRELIEVGTP
jgi:DNA polymerase-4